jgi:hypothetical protein
MTALRLARLFIVQPGVFVLIGVAITMAVAGRRTQELSRQLLASEELARAREEAALSRPDGRLLRCALRARRMPPALRSP